MEKRRIIITVLTVAALLVLGEQIYQLVHHDISHTTEPSKNTPAPLVINIPKINEPIYRTNLPPSVLANEEHLVTHQQQYIALVNQYELAKMQRQLLDEEVAIAAARQRIAEINQKTQQLTGKSFIDETTPITAQADPVNEHQQNLSHYQLVYLDHQGDNYTATLVNNGHYQEVSAGLQLADGDQIKQIDTQGVLLQTPDNKAFRLTFNGLVPAQEIPSAPEKVDVAQHIITPPPKKSAPTIKPKKIQQKITSTYTLIATKQLKKSAKANHKTHSKKLNLALALPKAQANLFNPSTAKKVSSLPKTDLGPAPIHLAVSDKPVTPNRTRNYTLDEILLLELPPTTYTIELKSGYNKQDLIHFAQQNDLGENAIYYATPRDHKTWHVLLYSYFNTKEEAQQAMLQLPAAMQEIHPQIEPVTDIQRFIKTEKQ